MSHDVTPPLVSTRFRANLIWLGKKPFVQGRDYKLKIHTQSQPVTIHSINKVIDASEAGSAVQKKQVDRHDVADVVLETRQSIAFDSIADNDSTGRFVIVDGYDIAGGGIIINAEKDSHEEFRAEANLRDFNWIAGGVTRTARADRLKHRAALVMFVGKKGVGKHKYARAVEKSLFDRSVSAYMLDGTNVLLGVDADLVWVESTQRELVRRFAEVAHLLLDAGHLVVSTTNSIGLADIASVQALIPDFPLIIVDVDPSSTSIAPCDLRLTGKESEETVISQISNLLLRQQIIES
jgi:bifunctional enzyme CysN/CysC